MFYLWDFLELKFNLLVLLEYINRDEYLVMVGGFVCVVVIFINLVVGVKFFEKLFNVEIVVSFSVGLDKVSIMIYYFEVFSV